MRKYKERSVLINYYDSYSNSKGYDRGNKQLNDILKKGWKVKTVTPLSNKHIISYVLYKNK